MSHWAQLVNSRNTSDGHLELCNFALAEIQDETRRRLIARLEKWIEESRDILDFGTIDGLELAVLVLKGEL